MKLKDNKIYRCIIIPICIVLCLFGRFIPGKEAFSSSAIGVLTIFLGCLILWLTIGIDWPSVLCIFSISLLPEIGVKGALSNSFGNETFVFLLFTFICTYALSKTPLLKRIAIGFINFKLAKKSGHWFIFLFLFASLLLGLFISPTVLFVVLLPILNEILKIAKIDKGDKVGKVLMIGLGFTVSISSGMTPIAHVFPILAMNAAQVNVSALSYMAFAIPTGLVVFVLMYLIFRIFIHPDVSKLENADVSSLKEELPKFSKQELISLIIFALVIVLWIVPGLFENITPEFKEFYNGNIKSLLNAMPAILGTILLCVIRVDNAPLIKIEDALKNGIPWSCLLMCAATLVLGVALTSDKIGIKAFLETNLSSSLNSLPSILLLIIFLFWAAIQTNLSSNMVTATLVASVASQILPSSGTSLNIPVIICLIGMLASFAFATPPSMPHIAIVAGSDYADTKDVLIYGSILMVVSVLAALVVGYPLGSLIV